MSGSSTMGSMVVMKGWYRFSDSARTVYECTYQPNCVGGTNGTVAEPLCREGSSGILCSTCDSAAAPGTDSHRRVEPALPALLPFALSLNGQQWATNELDETAEVWRGARLPCHPRLTLTLSPLLPPLPPLSCGGINTSSLPHHPF